MILTFLLSVLLYFNTNNSNADSALQEVLNLNEVKSYFTKSPRFTSSDEKSIVLLNSSNVTLTDKAEINSRNVQILNTDNIVEKELIVFLKLNELTIDENIASINLTIQNARLLLEDKQQVEVIAQLNKKGDNWEVKKYDLKRINISF